MIKAILEFCVFLFEAFVCMIETILAKNPCKKCLVRACCSEQCEERTVYLNFGSLNGVVFQKVVAISIIFSTAVLAFGVFTMIVK